MTQTTGQITGKDLTIEVSTDDSSYTDISGSSNATEPGGGERKTGSAYTFGEDTPMVSVGKPEPVTVKLKIIYTEVTSEAADLIDGYYNNKTLVYLRYRPKGALATQWQFKGQGYFTSPVFPKITADNAAPVMVDVNWFGTEMVQSAQT